MKLKFLVSVALFFGCISITNAQGFALGIKGGANFGKVDGQSFKEEFKAGYQLGGFATVPISRTFAIQPEVIFNQTNTRISDDPASVIAFRNLQGVELKELLIPILLNINFNSLLTLQVGPQFNLIIDQDKNIVNNVGDAFKSGTFAADAGVQLNLGSFRIYGRFTTGVNNINNVGLNNFREKESWKIQNIQLGLGLSLF